MVTADEVSELVVLRAVFDHLGAGVFATDTSGRVIASNPRAEQILGRPVAPGPDLHDLLCRASDGTVPARRQCRLHAALAEGRSDEGSDEFFLREDGALIPVVWATTPLRMHGRTSGAVLVFRDHSAPRAAQAETAEYLAALEELTARLSLLSEVSSVLASTLEIREGLQRVSQLLVPELADWAAVDLCSQEADAVRRVAAHSRGSPLKDRIPLGPVLGLPADSALARVLRGGKPVLLGSDDLAREAIRPSAIVGHRDLFDQLGARTAIVVGLRSRRRVFGALTAARSDDSPPYSDVELTMLADIGRRVGVMVHNALLYAQQRHVAETMQRSLLAPLPRVGHLRLAARYRPAADVSEVGGDWYDAFVLPDGVTALVIGDVVGHDLQAAAKMAELRNMLRALSWDRQDPPSLIMQRCDDAMTHVSTASMATVFLARVEGPEGGPWRLKFTNAGHPPPLLVTADGNARYLEDNPDPPLGMFTTLEGDLGIARHDVIAPLPPESTLLLYTDGLIEDRSRSLDTGMTQLRQHASALARVGIDDFCDTLLHHIDPYGDDVALLALRVPEAGARG